MTNNVIAYKTYYIIRGLIKQGTEAQVVIIPVGREFITPVILSALTSKPVISEFLAQRDGTWNSHVDLSLWTDAMLIAPATVSTIGKMASGMADSILITIYLSVKALVFITPAVDLDMCAHPSTQKNLDILRSYGNHIIEPITGEPTSHLIGKGHMEEPEDIIRVLDGFSSANTELQGRKIMITAGSTYEEIDPVHSISNYSSGKMGFAPAEECTCHGAEVTLIAGSMQLKTQHSRIRQIDVESAQEMCEAMQICFPTSDAGILCVTVADFRSETVAGKKIKWEKEGELALHLQTTQDIAASLGKIKGDDQLPVGFAPETNNEQQNIEGKLERKNFDSTTLNSLNDAGAGFRHDTNKISTIDRKGHEDYPLGPKQEIAQDIIDHPVSVLTH